VEAFAYNLDHEIDGLRTVVRCHRKPSTSRCRVEYRLKSGEGAIPNRQPRTLKRHVNPQVPTDAYRVSRFSISNRTVSSRKE